MPFNFAPTASAPQPRPRYSAKEARLISPGVGLFRGCSHTSSRISPQDSPSLQFGVRKDTTSENTSRSHGCAYLPSVPTALPPTSTGGTSPLRTGTWAAPLVSAELAGLLQALGDWWGLGGAGHVTSSKKVEFNNYCLRTTFSFHFPGNLPIVIVYSIKEKQITSYLSSLT